MNCENCHKSTSVKLVEFCEWDTLEQRVTTRNIWLCLQCWLDYGGKFSAAAHASALGRTQNTRRPSLHGADFDS
jgi:hypothetical protein